MAIRDDLYTDDGLPGAVESSTPTSGLDYALDDALPLASLEAVGPSGPHVEVITVTEFVTRAAGTLGKAVFDTVTVVESVRQRTGVALTRSDAITVADVVTPRLVTALRATVFDAITVADVVSTRTTTAVRLSVNDALTIAESVTQRSNLAKRLVETITVADHVAGSPIGLGVRSERITVTEFVQLAIPLLMARPFETISVDEGPMNLAPPPTGGTGVGVGPAPSPVGQDVEDYWTVGI
jgi:hypothetical protein